MSSDRYQRRVLHKDGRITVREDGWRRTLHIDGETLQSSMLLAEPVRLDLEYSQAMMCSLLFRPEPESVLLVGLGGGSLVRFLLRFCSRVRIDVAEIDTEVVRIARRYFFVPENDRLRIFPVPGQELVADRLGAGARYDIVLLDAFDDHGPARALLEERFLAQCQALLGPDGVFAMNLWNRPQDDFPTHWERLRSLFGNGTCRLIVGRARTNGIVFGLPGSVHGRYLMQLKPVATALSRRTGINFVRFLRRLHEQNISP
ncbi:fused MFS/spermidine synthase [Desulfolithobacter sp.]